MNHHHDEHSKAFARNRWITKTMLVLGGIKLIWGAYFIADGDFEQASFCLLMAAIWFLNYQWSSKTPFIMLSNSGFTLRRSPLAPRKVVLWDNMMDLRRTGPNRVTLHVVNGP
ncbi:MAG: hypothetical protein M0036_08380, partial [Desulfobacteraceae bacterium]|nr:hypothetical protein [Desulfobacteraceae bacterium]